MRRRSRRSRGGRDGPSRVGMTTAIAGRSTSVRRRTWKRDAASIAPVFPAETTASASPSPTARQAATSELSGFARTASTGFSCMRDRVRGLHELEALACRGRPGRRGSAGSSRTRPPVRPRRSRPGLGRRPWRRPPHERERSFRPYGAGARSGSTSRPRYVLQVGHTRCGRFGWWQTGHSLTRGALQAMRGPPLVAAGARLSALGDCHDRPRSIATRSLRPGPGARHGDMARCGAGLFGQVPVPGTGTWLEQAGLAKA